MMRNSDFAHCKIGLRNMAARIQFSIGIDEEVVPDVRITRSRDGSNGTATFYFQNPKALSESRTEEITGMYLVDDEGEIVTRDVNAKFVNGQPEAIEALLKIKSAEDFDRFIRFMNRYAEEHDLGFNKS
jgi:photosystem II protein